MRKLVILLALTFTVLISGCETGTSGALSPLGAGLHDNPEARNIRIDYIHNVETRMLLDDIDMVMLQERSSRLSPYTISVGR